MNILFHASTSSNPDVTSALLYMLNKYGHSVEICSSVLGNAEVHYDIILTSDKKNLKLINDYAKQCNIPLIYIFTQSTIADSYPEDYNLASAFLLIRDSELSVDAFTPPFVKEIRLSYPIQHKNNDKGESKEGIQKVLVAIDTKLPNYRTLLKILSNINIPTLQLEYTITNFPESLTGILNNHVKTIQIADDSLFYGSDFIIASGCYVHKAIKSLKPCIILGDRGYGGMLDEENLEMQYQHYFQGRIGAELDEQIPLDFLWHDILYLKNAGETLKDISRTVYNEFMKFEESNIQNLNHLLNQVLDEYRKINLLQNTRLEQSYAFKFSPLGSDYLMIKQKTNQAYSTIEEEEMNIINAFIKPCTCEEVHATLEKGSYDKDEFIDFVRELLEEKVLQIAYNQ